MYSSGKYGLVFSLLWLFSCASNNGQAALETAWQRVAASKTSQQETQSLNDFSDVIREYDGDLQVTANLENGRQLDLNTTETDSSRIDSFSLRVHCKGGTFQANRWQPKQLANVYLLFLK